MGYGIGGNKLFGDPSKDLVVDLMTADGKVIPKKIHIQKPGIKNLTFDWSRIIDENATQLVTVGHHWKLSRALNKEELSKLDRRGVCLSCHKTMPDSDLAVSLMVHVAQTAGVKIDNEMHKSILHKNLLLSAWVQVLGAVLIVFGLGYWWIRRRK